MTEKRPMVILTGPTAVGKTALSIELAKKINGSIISADSMQVYRHMDIGSAKVMPEEMDGVRHYLIDEFEPDEEFHVVKFVERAKEHLEEIYAEGKIPIIAGGTGFYIQALLYDIDFEDTCEDTAYRTQLEDKTGEFPLRALLIILVYIGGLFGIVEYYLDKNSGTFITLPRMYRVAGKPLYAFISCVLFAVSAMLTLAVAGQLKGAADILHMVVYVIAVTLFAWLVAIPVRRANAMISIIPVLLIACLILCPVFINITAYVPFAKYIRALLLPWYMLK